MIKSVQKFAARTILSLQQGTNLMSRHDGFDAFTSGVPSFRDRIASEKKENRGFPWYPYDTMSNVHLMDQISTSEIKQEFDRPLSIADIGAADGDLSFYLESLGHKVDIYDYGPTNMNGLRAARSLKQSFGSDVGIYEIDIDKAPQFERSYDIAVFLGIIYHLKNPYLVLETLALRAKYAFISTRIAENFTSSGQSMVDVPCAYLLDAQESNNDATNYWIFTAAGLRRIVHRCGWDIIAEKSHGFAQGSTPQDNHKDQRMFMSLRSRHF